MKYLYNTKGDNEDKIIKKYEKRKIETSLFELKKEQIKFLSKYAYKKIRNYTIKKLILIIFCIDNYKIKDKDLNNLNNIEDFDFLEKLCEGGIDNKINYNKLKIPNTKSEIPDFTKGRTVEIEKYYEKYKGVIFPVTRINEYDVKEWYEKNINKIFELIEENCIDDRNIKIMKIYLYFNEVPVLENKNELFLRWIELILRDEIDDK